MPQVLEKYLKILYSDKRSQVNPFLLLVGTFIIAFIGWKFTKDISQSVDILFWDEANYMHSGQMIGEKFNKSWGPAYALWYRFLSLFEKDSIALYYLNYRWMTILPAVGIFLFLTLSNVRFWASFFIAVFFIFADINLPVWPKVSHYNIFIFLIGLSLMRYVPGTLTKVAFISLFALNNAYARPEFYLSYIGILVLWIVALFIKDFRNKRAIYFSVFLTVIGFLIQFKMGNPLFNFQGDRSALAFAQHFMLNYFEWNHIDYDFWLTWMPYYQDLFHNAPSIREAIVANKELFELHILTNIQHYFGNVFNLFSDAMLPESIIRIPLKGRLIILLSGGLVMLTFVFKNKYLEILNNSFKRNRLVLIILLLWVFPTIISCILIYPRLHYMIFHYILLIFLIALLVFPSSKEKPMFRKSSFLFSLILLAVVFVRFPSTNDYSYFDLYRKEKSMANLRTVEKIQSYHFQDSVRVLENEGGMNLFLGDKYIWIRGFMKDTTWTGYLEKEKVDIIYVTPSLTKYPTLESDSTWFDFQLTPEKYGFEKIKTGNHTPFLYIREKLLSKN
ncbi:MAG: hypothetical protein M9887_11920 [Chitinophagales bacterium]|nr:hypothetical protein [Chitinophagales bacterium]